LQVRILQCMQCIRMFFTSQINVDIFRKGKWLDACWLCLSFIFWGFWYFGWSDFCLILWVHKTRVCICVQHRQTLRKRIHRDVSQKVSRSFSSILPKCARWHHPNRVHLLGRSIFSALSSTVIEPLHITLHNAAL
jgi:hypothetical protein